MIGLWRVLAVAFAVLLLLRGAAGAAGADPTILAVGALYAVLAVAVVVGRPHRLLAVAWALTPLILLLSPSGTELAFSLVARDSDAWRLHAIAAVLAGGAVGGVGLLAALRAEARLVTGLAAAALGAVAALGALSALAPTTYGDRLSDAEVAALPVIELVDVRFEPGSIEIGRLPAGRALVRNVGSLPHTLTVPGTDIDLYVPAGREAVVSLATIGTEREMICLVGDHADRGMRGLVTP